MQITAKSPKHDRAVTCEFDMPETLQGMIEAFGEGPVKSNAEDSIVINIQALIRRAIAAGKTDDEVQALVTSYKPGQSVRVGGDPLKTFETKFDAMSKDEQDAYIAELMERQKAS